MRHDYAERLEARRERYSSLASSKAKKGRELHKAGTDALAQIPFGQPILVGHHSERADRAYRARGLAKIERGYEEMDKAEYYANKAESVGTAGISQDDPEAITKLKAKLWKLEEQREKIKALNKAAKASGHPELMSSSYVLANLGANIRTVAKRIETLEKQEQMEARPDVVGNGYIIRENKEANRIQFLFEGKPDDATRTLLKRNGFRWSPTESAWQTWLTNRGRHLAVRVHEELTKSVCQS